MKPAEWVTVRQAAILVDRDVSRIYRWIEVWSLDHRRDGEVTVVRTAHLLQIDGMLHITPNARPTRRAP